MLISEHRLHWLNGIADRFVYLEGGRILWQRTPEQMLNMPSEDCATLGLRSFALVPSTALSAPVGDGAPAISASGLGCTRRGHRIWEDIDFFAWAGQVVAITGRNGAGKTTLAKALCGLIRPSGGTVRLDGKPLRAVARRKRVWCSDNDTGAQFFTDSVSEELLLCSDRSEQTLERARALLRELELYAHKDAHPATLSGGQKQRLSIACGLLSNRPVMIFDEPTSGLDGRNLRLVGNLLRRAAEEGKCVLVISHDGELIRACCTHGYALGS